MAKLISQTKIQSTDYSDSNEQRLLELFKKPIAQVRLEIENILQNKPSWLDLYHLSPQRRFIADWYPYENGAKVLEIGAGCGAVTAGLCELDIALTAAELSPIRAEVAYERLRNYEKLTVVAGDIFQLAEQFSKFDYIVVIGVLEYAGVYGAASKDGVRYLDPFQNFLKLLRPLLNPKGKIILAIENKLGLKYFTGSQEDHSHFNPELFSSLEDYPNYQGVRTFNQTELAVQFNQAGFKNIDWYYPYPDYKFPQQIITAAGHNIDSLASSGIFPITDWMSPRTPMFSEVTLANNMRDLNIAHLFSNSLLAVAEL